MRLAFCVALLFAACAATQARPNLPGTYGTGEALPPPVAPEPGGALAPVAAPTAPAASATAPTTIPAAEADFRDAKARFDSGRAGGGARVAGRVRRPPRAAPVPARGRSDAGAAGAVRGDAAAAKGLLEPLVSTPPDPGTASSARYYLGHRRGAAGQSARGRELLLPFLPAAGAAGPGDEALVELRGALAEATAASGDLTAALELWDGYARGGREHEKAYARARAAELAADVAPDAAARAWRASAEKGLARARAGREGGRLRARAGRIPAAPRRSTPRRRPRATRWASTTCRRRRRDRATPDGWGWRLR